LGYRVIRARAYIALYTSDHICISIHVIFCTVKGIWAIIRMILPARAARACPDSPDKRDCTSEVPQARFHRRGTARRATAREMLGDCTVRQADSCSLDVDAETTELHIGAVRATP
jgi:hypothetical protein